MARNSFVIAASAALLVHLLACDPADDGGDDGDMGAPTCEEEERADDFVAGMEKNGENGMVSVALVDSDPAPPTRADNTWTIMVTDADGAAVEGAQIAVDPRMPDHGHGTPVNAEVSAGEAAGEYILDPVNLFMQGYWEVTVDVTLADDGGTDTVMFQFCVD